MVDDNLFSAPKSPVSGHHQQYSPLASRLIRESQDSIKSSFSPAAFEDTPSTGTDASIDQETEDLDLDDLADSDDLALSNGANEQHVPLAADIPVAPETSSTPLVTPSAEKKTLFTFDPTPYRKALGRNYSRSTIFDKASIMHVYGGLGVLTLLGGVLHMCHVLAVATNDKLLDQLAYGIGEKLINLNSSLNFWILTPTFHYAVDTGLIKFLPTEGLMDAMEQYLEELHELMEKRANEEITSEEYDELVNGSLRRRKLFPPANYAFLIVGILCHSNFRIPRHVVDDQNSDLELPAEEVHNENTKYEINIKRFPVPLRRTQTSQTRAHDPKTARVLPDFRSVNPTTYDKDEVFWLWQDPFFVLINAGEFVHALRKRWESQHSGDHDVFSLDPLVHNKRHSILLQRAFDLYEMIKKAPPPPNITKILHETPSRPSRMTRSWTAPSRNVDKSRASTKTKNLGAAGSQRMAGKKRDASAMDGNNSRTEGTRRSRRLKLEEPEPDMNGQTQL
ncbi:hypothetical protein PM082_000361 [Marasmius tenuissimus]|nr:hypothetical protein PM082_000361 [Marasmius tenuissimus]